MARGRGGSPGTALARAARRAGVTDPRVIEAVSRVDRRGFVPPGAEAQAGHDAPVAIGSGQTTSQPSLVALMVEALELRGGERVLEVGSGHGYQTALLAELAGEVWSLERYLDLAEAAAANLADHGADNARVRAGDGTRGLPEAAPFDAIIVSAATTQLPPAWAEQLAEGGRLVVPLGDHGYQEVMAFRARGGELVRDRVLTPVRFVPLVAEE